MCPEMCPKPGFTALSREDQFDADGVMIYCQGLRVQPLDRREEHFVCAAYGKRGADVRQLQLGCKAGASDGLSLRPGAGANGTCAS